MRHVTLCVTFVPEISGFALEINGQVESITAPGNSQENLKTVEFDENPLMRHK